MPPLTIQQLNHAQWHVVDPCGDWHGSGATDWADAVASALWGAMLTPRAVESISLTGDRLLLLRAGGKA